MVQKVDLIAYGKQGCVGKKVTEWIDIKERLPDCDIFVLATDGKKSWVACNYKNGDFCSWICTCCNFHECDFEATHWMPLPELPKIV